MIYKMVVAVVITCIWHELGHIIAIVLFNIKHKRSWNDFAINLTKSKIVVTHAIFPNGNANMVIALAGPILPTILASLLVLLDYLPNYSGFIFIISLVHLIFLCPLFADGKNIKKYLK